MTPKTLDKYIAALKKKAAAGGWSSAQYQAELDKIKDEMAQQYLDNKITSAEYTKVSKQLANAEKNTSLQGKASWNAAAQTAKTLTKDGAVNQLMDLLTDLDEQYKKLKNSGQPFDSNAFFSEYNKVANAANSLNNGAISIEKAMSAAEGAQKLLKATGKQQTPAPQGMTHEEYIGLWEALNKKKKAGLISENEYYAMGGKLDKAYQDKKQVSDVEKEIGCDPGTLATDDSIIKLGKEFRKVYGQAAKEMQAELDKFLAKYKPEMDALNQKLLDGTITPEEFQKLKMQTLQQKTMQQKIEQLAGTMTEANKKAMKLINGEMLNVFAENANYQSYELSQDAKVNLMFSVYDERTAQKLIRDNPELLPRKEVNGKKDKAWNQKVISSAVAQAVIQGDSIPKLAKRIAAQTGETNMKAMTRYARTAMTSAQNSGRMEMLHAAQGMGIKCKKVWLATLDSRTRDAHGKLDGQKAEIDKPFMSEFGEIMYPGDMGSKGSVPANLYNCRCTLIYEYEGFPNDPGLDQRIQYDEWDETVTVTKKDKNGKEYEAQEKIHHRESKLITDMSYGEWKAAKQGSKLNELNAAKLNLAELQKQIVKKKVSETKKYEGIWKDPVTLADYADKKDKIQGKRDYYEAEIQKYKDAQANGASWATDDKIKELQKHLKQLNEFEENGKLIEKRNDAIKEVQQIYDQVGFAKSAAAPEVQKAVQKAKKAAVASGGTNTGVSAQTGAGLSLSSAGEKKTPFVPESYTQERKDQALWTTDRKKVDDRMRDRTGEVWSNATDKEREAIYEYTRSYSKYNEPLRGIEYGTSRYLGVGNTDLNASYAKNGKRLNAMTDIIDKCSYGHDQWLQRGCGWGGMDKFFNVSPDLLRYGSEKELQKALLGTTPTEYGFMSMGSAKGNGFSGNILMNIYAPAGTKMMYVEPFSAYSGSSDHMSWDGKKKQSRFGSEFETIMQQGTQFRVTKVEKKGGQIFVDMEVINQDHQQRWKK